MVGHQEKVAFIWSIAELLRSDYKQSEYGRVSPSPTCAAATLANRQIALAGAKPSGELMPASPSVHRQPIMPDFPVRQDLSQAIAPAPPSGSPANCTTAAAAFRRPQGCQAHAALLAVHRRALIMCVRAIASRTGYAPVTRLPRLPVRIGSESRAGGLTERSRSRSRPDRSPGACAPPDSMRASRKVDVFCSDPIEVEER